MTTETPRATTKYHQRYEIGAKPIVLVKTSQTTSVKIRLNKMPKTPLKTPTKKLSDVKIRLMSFLRAPMDLRTPISFVRSVTLIYKTTKIIIAETTSEMHEMTTSEVPMMLSMLLNMFASCSSIEPT